MTIPHRVSSILGVPAAPLLVSQACANLSGDDFWISSASLLDACPLASQRHLSIATQHDITPSSLVRLSRARKFQSKRRVTHLPPNSTSLAATVGASLLKQKAYDRDVRCMAKFASYDSHPDICSIYQTISNQTIYSHSNDLHYSRYVFRET